MGVAVLNHIASVLSGERRWACVQADALEFLRALPDDSVDLLFTSPPYEKARTYGISDDMPAGEEWVRWMVELVTAASPKVKGLIAINCEGQTRNYRYSCVPFLLIADLHRAGFNLRKPVVFHRVGIPGGGGPDWLRNDWETVLCVTRPGQLPWSDNTACGKPPKFEPGGDMSYRKPNGERVGRKCVTVRIGTERLADVYTPPDIANPGNVISLSAGKGHMGTDLAHENEAPFPLKLAEVFVKSFCPPDGIACDPFSGSGTVAEACVSNGRRFVGCDLRESQVELCKRRMRGVTPPLAFTE